MKANQLVLFSEVGMLLNLRVSMIYIFFFFILPS